MANGFIKIDRKILEWEHFKDHKTFKLFVALLLLAEYQDTVLPDGTEVKRGQAITSTRKLAEISGLSHKEVRAHIRALERTQEVAQLPSPKNTIVTVLNYDKYQDKGTEKGTEKGTREEERERSKEKEEEFIDKTYRKNFKEYPPYIPPRGTRGKKKMDLNFDPDAIELRAQMENPTL